MMPNKVVSIIVPVYNAKDSLHYCMNSILNQSYKRLEVILVNDGSTDGSREICDLYALTDHRVKVIHQQNKGPSHARNKGIRIATGDYIQFVDADDHIHLQMTETLVNAIAEHTQFIICGYQTIDINKNRTITKKYIPSLHGKYQMEDFMPYFGELYKDLLIPSPCNKLYNAHLIHQEKITFVENLNYGEDLLFNLTYLSRCQSVQIIPEQLYNYFITSKQSLSRKFHENLVENQQILHKKVKSFLLEHDSYTDKNKHFMNIIYADQVVIALNNLFHINSTYTPEQRKEQIITIISSKQLITSNDFFRGSLQAKIIGKMIKYNLNNVIYYFFHCKQIMRYLLKRNKELNI